MPATAEKYEIDYSEAVLTEPRSGTRSASTHPASPANWRRMESLVEHFGDSAVVEPPSRPRRKSRIAVPEYVPIEAPRQISHAAPRRAVRHQPFRLSLSAVIMWSTVGMLTLFLLGLNAATLALSQHDADVTKQIKLSQQAIDNSNKSIAAIQVSPQTAQWAMMHGWRIASQTDFDEVPSAPQASPEAGGAQ